MSWHGQQWWVPIICSARSTFSYQLDMHFTHTSLRLQHVILVLVLFSSSACVTLYFFFLTTIYFGSWSRLHRWIVIPYKLRSLKPSLVHLNLCQCCKVRCTSSFSFFYTYMKQVYHICMMEIDHDSIDYLLDLHSCFPRLIIDKVYTLRWPVINSESYLVPICQV